MPQGRAKVSTGAAGPQLSRGRAVPCRTNDDRDDGWVRQIDKIVGDWLPDLATLDDGEFTPPSLAVIGLSCEIAEGFRRRNAPAPDRVVLDGDGGLVFERRRGDLIESIEVYGDSEPKAELVLMQGGKVVHREELLTSSEP